MKKYFFIVVLLSLALGSCKSDSNTSDAKDSELKSETDSEFKTISGEFIYTDTVAVFKKTDGIYGVIMNAKAKDLIAQAKEMNPDPFASFDVTLEAGIKENTVKDAWPQVIDIQNIIKVEPSSTDDSLRLDK